MKMYKSCGFSLLEVLIAMSMSAFILLGLLQSYRSLMKYISRTGAIMSMSRRGCLVLGQMERDFSTAFIPQDQDNDGKKLENPSAVSPQNERLKEAPTVEKEKKLKRKTYFFALAEEGGEVKKVDDRKLMPFKSVTFISTNPLQIFGQRKVRFVRVMYELVKNKERSLKGKISYDLVRKESGNIDDAKMKIDEFDYEKQKKSPIRSDVVAEDVKVIYCEYTGIEKTKKDEKQKTASERDKKKEEDKEVTLSAWGEKEFTQGVVPKYVSVYLELWDDKLQFADNFHAIFPILTFPTPDPEEDKKKDTKLPDGGKPSQNQPAGAAQLPNAQGLQSQQVVTQAQGNQVQVQPQPAGR